MIVYLAFVAVLNLLLGYALAVCLHEEVPDRLGIRRTAREMGQRLAGLWQLRRDDEDSLEDAVREASELAQLGERSRRSAAEAKQGAEQPTAASPPDLRSEPSAEAPSVGEP